MPLDSYSSDRPPLDRGTVSAWLRFSSVWEREEGRLPEALAAKMVAAVFDEQFKAAQPRTWARLAEKLSDLMLKGHQEEAKAGAGDGHVVEVILEFGPPKEHELNGHPETTTTEGEPPAGEAAQ